MNVHCNRSPEHFDPDFGNAGLAPIPAHLKRIYPQLLDDQRILSVAIEDRSNVATLIRHLGTGAIDESYGQQGSVRITLPLGPELGATQHRVLPDGGCLVFGSVGHLLQASGFVFRVLPDGNLDMQFGDAGFCILNIDVDTKLTGLELLSDGKAMVTLATNDGASFDFYLARLDNGHLDHTYGADGSGMVHIGTQTVYDMLVLPDDGVLVTAERSNFTKAAFYQFLPDGRPDPAFGEEGTFELVLPQQGGQLSIMAMARQADGKIVAVGAANVGFGNHFLITRLNADASLDTGFNNGEPKIMVYQGYEGQAESIAILPDNKLVVVGSASSSAFDDNFVLMRFLPNAMLDSDFGENGQIMTDFGERDIAHYSLSQADGKILVAGVSNHVQQNTHTALLVRYLG